KLSRRVRGVMGRITSTLAFSHCLQIFTRIFKPSSNRRYGRQVLFIISVMCQTNPEEIVEYSKAKRHQRATAHAKHINEYT
ncbi:PIPO, partial [Konjac mosaic virus]|uniref:PIPO n=1 Tax=Konjac mosaic virus TaxID=322053 RepID=UPI00026514C9